MKREVKFRIIAPTGEVFYMTIGDLLFQTFSKWNINELKIDQYTGLKDKNGTEIYEGDLLRFPAKDKWDETNYSAFEVFFHDGNESYGTGIGYRMCRMHNQGVIGGGVVPTFHPKNTERMEVIGNIHENKELL